jgi:hypothetical protein
MGPVLSFRGCRDGKWNLTALVVNGTDPGKLTAGNRSTKPEVLWEVDGRAAYRYTFSFPMAKAEKKASYAVMGEEYEVVVPAVGQAPTMAYASCNGFSSLKLMKGVKDNNALWKRMARKHGLSVPHDPKVEENEPPKDPITPYHLLLMGGDQVYADAMWETVPIMQEWSERPWAAGNAAPVPAGLPQELDRFYFNLYRTRWSQPEVARMLARVPTVMMWDDHDLIDGWGSYPKERQTSPVYGAMWKSASKAFAVFQQQLKDTDPGRPGGIGKGRPGPAFPVVDGAFSFGYVVGDVAILAMDMRSQRTAETQVIGAPHWNELYAWIENDLKDKKITHLLVLASIPVVYPGFDSLETLLGFLPGHQDLEDDLRDHWDSKPHKQERLRFIQRLLKVAEEDVRPTLLSGDVHVAALGTIERERAAPDTAINQLISSGIVHPGPGAVVLFALRHLFDSEDEIERGVIARMTKFPGNTAKFVGGRNYLSLEPDRDEENRRIWCNWLVEHDPHPYTKVISAKGRSRVAELP